MRSAIRAFDAKVGKSVKRLSPAWKPIMLFFTLLGQPPFTVGITAAVLGYGFALNKPYYEAAGIVSMITLALTSLLKLLLHRDRPKSAYAKNMLFQTFSFPSGHASGSLVSFGLLAVVISLRFPEWSVTATIVTIISCLLIGLSRIYLKAHFASDVIGGWIVGGAGLLIILYLLEFK